MLYKTLAERREMGKKNIYPLTGLQHVSDSSAITLFILTTAGIMIFNSKGNWYCQSQLQASRGHKQ